MADEVIMIFVIAFTANAIFISICTVILLNYISGVLGQMEDYLTQVLKLFSLK